LGRLVIPSGSIVYLDAAPIIYSVEKNPDYLMLMTEVWQQVEAGDIGVVTSELSLLEALVHPVRDDDDDQISAYETVLSASEMQLMPITTEVLRMAVNFRVNQNFKTPDAIHAATAFLSGSSHLFTNDQTFRRLENIDVIILSDLL